MSRITELTGHTSRVLHMTMSPDGQHVASAAADETLRLWKCFTTQSKTKKLGRSVDKDGASLMSYYMKVR